VPESAERHAERKRRAREAARRREATSVLRIIEATARYGASQLNGSGLGPEQARAVAVEVASELAMAAEALRRLARLGPAERRERARQLAALGWPKHRIAVQLGVSDVTVFNYLRPRSPGREALADREP
jgi:hypothetical protein